VGDIILLLIGKIKQASGASQIIQRICIAQSKTIKTPVAMLILQER